MGGSHYPQQIGFSRIYSLYNAHISFHQRIDIGLNDKRLMWETRALTPLSIQCKLRGRNLFEQTNGLPQHLLVTERGSSFIRRKSARKREGPNKSSWPYSWSRTIAYVTHNGSRAVAACCQGAYFHRPLQSVSSGLCNSNDDPSPFRSIPGSSARESIRKDTTTQVIP